MKILKAYIRTQHPRVIVWFDEFGRIDNSHGQPNIFTNGTKTWRKRNDLHRIDGPAMIIKYRSPLSKNTYYLDGKRMSKKTHERYLQNGYLNI